MTRIACHLIVAVLAVAPLGARQPSPEPATFNISVQGRAVGQETVTVRPSPRGWIISSTGGQALPTPITIDRFELEYDSNWQPVSLVIDAKQAGQLITLKSTFSGGTVTNNIMQGGQASTTTMPVSPRAVVLPNNFFGAYEALAARLGQMSTGSTIPIFVAPQAEVQATVTGVTPQRIQTTDKLIELRHYSLAVRNPGGVVNVEVAIDANNRLARVAVPAAGILVLRDDLSGVMTRDVTYRNDTDEAVFLPGPGFTIGATVTRPPSGLAGGAQPNAAGQHPAVVLIGGTGPADRDETIAGIPIFGQLSGALAKAGYVVVRYDKRGIGQSGGRIESVTLDDYADDVVSVVQWLGKQKDVDAKRIAIAGHSEGGMAALIAADRAGGKIAAVALLATPGTTGRELLLAQQRHQLEKSNDSAEVKVAKIQLQQRIMSAVITGTGWDGIPPALQRQADTLWFKSFLLFDPAQAMKKVDQPVLIVQGSLDTQVEPENADRLETMARNRKGKSGDLTSKILISGANHLFVPAVTGEPSEYATLPSRAISPELAATLVQWLPTAMTKK